MKIISACIIFVISFSTYANTNDDLKSIADRAEVQLSQIPAQKIENLKKLSDSNNMSHQKIIANILAKAKLTNIKHGNDTNDSILFVSLSMPQSLLLSLAAEAQVFNIPVVIRGMADNDFQKTIAAFTNLYEEARQQHIDFQGVSIDPIWFEQFKIEAVPALVVSIRDSNCAPATICNNQKFDVIYGNPHIKKSLELIADRGEDASVLARQILERGHV